MRRPGPAHDSVPPLALADYVRVGTGLLMLLLGVLILIRGIPVGGGVRALAVGGGLMVVGIARLWAMAGYLRGRRIR